jgi:tetratricopeptide (TPR) repeat protein
LEALIAPQRDKAAALAAQGDLRGASEAWKVVLTIDPRDAVALAESKSLAERIQQAIAERMARGREALKRNVHLEARGHFLAVLAMNPGHKEAFDALQTQVREVRQLNHTVRAGESLASIAQFYYGDRVRSEVIWGNQPVARQSETFTRHGAEDSRDTRLTIRAARYAAAWQSGAVGRADPRR